MRNKISCGNIFSLTGRMRAFWSRFRAGTVMLVTVAIVGCVFFLRSEPPQSMGRPLPAFWTKLPEPNQNNLWYEKNNSDTVFIFVHGIFSDSRTCWLYDGNAGFFWTRNQSGRPPKQYWPELVKSDPVLEHPSVYLGGYFTAIDAGAYDAEQASNELRRALINDGVLEKKNLIFVAHSTGGIIARYLLDHDRDLFRRKRIGLLLYASPSLGSDWATKLSFLSEFYNQKLGKQLKDNSEFLNELDHNFRNLLYNPDASKDNPRIIGAEALENYFIIHHRLIPDHRYVVSETSGSRYFGAPQMLSQTDHFSIVKPKTLSDPSHQFLVTFYKQKFNQEFLLDNYAGENWKWKGSRTEWYAPTKWDTEGPQSRPALIINGPVWSIGWPKIFARQTLRDFVLRFKILMKGLSSDGTLFEYLLRARTPEPSDEGNSPDSPSDRIPGYLFRVRVANGHLLINGDALSEDQLSQVPLHDTAMQTGLHALDGRPTNYSFDIRVFNNHFDTCITNENNPTDLKTGRPADREAGTTGSALFEDAQNKYSAGAFAFAAGDAINQIKVSDINILNLSNHRALDSRDPLIKYYSENYRCD